MANNRGGFDEMDDQDEFDGVESANEFSEFAIEGFDFLNNTPKKAKQPNKPDISTPFENINIGDILTVVAAPSYEIPTGLTGYTMREDTTLHNNILLVTSLELPFIGATNFSRVFTDVGYERLVFNGYSEYKFFKLSDDFVKSAMYATRYKDLDKKRKEVLKNAKGQG